MGRSRKIFVAANSTARLESGSILSLVLALILATGCATVTRGTDEIMVINTDPPQADIRIDQDGKITLCESPCSVKVKRRGNLFISIEKDGYELIETNVASSIDGGGAAGMAGNVLIGGIIGAGIDAGSGAMHSHKPNPLTITLKPLAYAATGSEWDPDTGSEEADFDPLGLEEIGDRPEASSLPVESDVFDQTQRSDSEDESE